MKDETLEREQSFGMPDKYGAMGLIPQTAAAAAIAALRRITDFSFPWEFLKRRPRS